MVKKIKLRKAGTICTLDHSDVLGTGGEATVVKVGDMAVKIYHQPDNLRREKVEAFVNGAHNLPICVCAPQDIAFDLNNKFQGFAMPLIPKGGEVVQQLCSRSFRNSHPECTTKFVANLFLNAYDTIQKLHASGIVIGDMNDLNVMFRHLVMFFMDADSFQIGKFPCMVGTENFLVPELYNLDLATNLYFKKEYDWYAYFIMFIRSTILTHIYGGVHNQYRSITQRALARKIVTDSDVKYPKPALHPDILSTSMWDLAHRAFSNGERFVFPREAMVEYADSLVECHSCHTWHPSERSSCPQCSTINTQQIQRRVNVVQSPGKRIVNAQEIFVTKGNFVWWKPSGGRFYAIAIEGGAYTLYKKASLSDPSTSMSLFKAKSGTHFDMFDDKFLVVNTNPETDEILVLDVSGTAPIGYTKKAADEYVDKRCFAASRNHLLRIQQGYLYRGGHLPAIGQFGERQIIAVSRDQTWIVASPYSTFAFGWQRFFNQYEYFLYRFDRKEHGERYVVPIPALDAKESLIDVGVEIWVNSVLCMLKTEILGKTYTRVFIIGDEGNIISQYKLEALSSDTHRKIHGKAFARPSDTQGIILHPTDDGVVQQVVGKNDVGQLSLLSETEPFVAESDSLMLFKDGIMVVSSDTINYITIGS